MSKSYLFFVLICLLVGCKPNKKNENKAELTIGCYGYAKAGTKITFQITRTDPLVQGTLIYDWAEKDRSSGSFNGNFDNGLILGTYTFISEGIESSREIAFKVKDSTLIEGYGDVTAAGKITTFKNVDNLSFDPTFKLTKGKCIN